MYSSLYFKRACTKFLTKEFRLLPVKLSLKPHSTFTKRKSIPPFPRSPIIPYFHTYKKNNMKFLPLTILVFISQLISAQITKPEVTEVWDPEPRVVTPGKIISDAPSDAIVLFDGSNGDAWKHFGDKPFGWTISDGMMTVAPETGFLVSKQHFNDIQLHMEFRTPAVVEGEGLVSFFKGNMKFRF